MRDLRVKEERKGRRFVRDNGCLDVKFSISRVCRWM